MPTDKQIKTLKNKLEKLKSEYEESLEMHAEQSEDEGELSSADQHPGEQGTELFEYGRDEAIDNHLQEKLDEVKLALSKIEDGTYGKCEISGEDIPFERLEVMPSARTKVEHANELDGRIEFGEQRAVPRGFDGHTSEEQTGYDKEDTWKDMERHGTSQTPADHEDGKTPNLDDQGKDNY